MKNTTKLLLLLCSVIVNAGCEKKTEPPVDYFPKAIKAFDNGDYEKAIELFDKAAENSDNPAIYANRANCYSYLGKLDEALKDYNSAISKSIEIFGDENDPRLAMLYYNRGYAYDYAGKYEKAIEDYEKTISLNNKYPDVKNHLAWILATCSEEEFLNPKRALSLAVEAEQEHEGYDISILDTLAAAYAANGDFKNTEQTQIGLVHSAAEEETKKKFIFRLNLYKKKEPYIDSPENKALIKKVDITKFEG